MSQPLDLQIRAELAQFLAGETTLAEFDRWFSTESWNVHQLHDLVAEELTYTIELALAERSQGDISDEQLKRELVPLVTNYTTFWPAPELRVALTTNAVTTHFDIIWEVAASSQSVDAQRAVVSA